MRLEGNIIYTCKKCGWKTAVRVEWADARPKRCCNKKCGISFSANPEQLDIALPVIPVVTIVDTTKKKKSKKQEDKNV